jgi:hypothetical protein
MNSECECYHFYFVCSTPKKWLETLLIEFLDCDDATFQPVLYTP